MRALLIGAIAALGLASAANANSVIYQNDFNTGSTAGFSGAANILTAPSGEKFLGPLSLGDEADLTLNTAGKSSITLNFDLYALQSLDGDGTSFCCGPDIFALKVNGSSVLMSDTFSNNPGWTQSYGGPGSPGGTGSDPSLTGVLGYNYYGPDHTYHLSFVIPVSGPSTVVNFIGATNQGWNDEGFGVDNVVVSGVSAVPEPASWAMMIAGFGLIGWAARRRMRAASAA
jgi:hypothetical protein